ncbi:unnamed protein product [Ectocarpus sp. 4 AP-2014]
MHFRQPCAEGVFLHNERDTTHVRRDGSIPKPSTLERYLHRPLDIIFDTMDIITYLSNFGMSSSPPAYADGHQWEESEWPDDDHALFVYRRRATAKIWQDHAHLDERLRQTALPPAGLTTFGFYNTMVSEIS